MTSKWRAAALDNLSSPIRLRDMTPEQRREACERARQSIEGSPYRPMIEAIFRRRREGDKP